MTFRHLGSSPLLVVFIAASAAGVWTCGYGAESGPIGQARAKAESTAGAEPGDPSEPVPSPLFAGQKDEASPSRRAPRVRTLSDRVSEHPVGVDIGLEEATAGGSLTAFYEALARVRRGEGKARVVVYGASHVASDLFTGELRTRLQMRFGDGGQGFFLPVKPWRFYRHQGIEFEGARGWKTHRVRASDTEIRPYGLAGVYVETDRATRTAFELKEGGSLGTRADSYELYYLEQPGGGDMQLVIDGKVAGRIRTRGSMAKPAYRRFTVPPKAKRFELRTTGNGPVRIYGGALERDQPGVVIDTLGINGARARYHLLWEDALYREHLTRREPDLVVLAYGTNESGDEAPIEQYEDELRRVLGRIRETVPRASCLLVGPSDRPVRVERTVFEDRPRTDEVIAVQHRVALDYGCAFFDLVAFQGGPLSMVEWAAADPPYAKSDHIHFTARGYYRLGEVLEGALLEFLPEQSTVEGTEIAGEGPIAPPSGG